MKSTDGELLARFTNEQDETAFEEIVQRHGRMVMGVCTRILGDQHDAEDALQATFLVLARKAATLKVQNSLAGWLHSVALRVGLRARGKSALRRKREKEAGMIRPDEHEDSWQQLQPVLDEELGKLADNHRLPIVLCCIEEKTYEEAALELGWTSGALRSRLAKGRELLRRRLSRKGIALSIGLLFSLITEKALATPPSPVTVSATVSAAGAFANGNNALSGMISENAMALADETVEALWWSKVTSTAVNALSIMLAAAVIVWLCLPGANISPPVDTGQQAGIAHKKPGETSSPMSKPPVSPDLTHLRKKAPRNLPEILLTSILKKYPKAEIHEVEKEEEGGKTVYEVVVILDDREIELLLAENGTILEEEREVPAPESGLPRAVREQLRLRYPGSRIREAEESRREGKVTYEIELQTDKKEIEVTFSPAGELLGENVRHRRKEATKQKKEVF